MLSINDKNCDSDEGLKGGTMVSVSDFELDARDVTVRDYQTCMDAKKCTRPDKDHTRSQYCNFAAKDRANHLVNCLDWQQAQDYCH